MPIYGECDFCHGPCINARLCEKCGKVLCSGQLSMCWAAHGCKPRLEPSFIEKELERQV
jgi:hypothetical protein